MYSVWAYMEIAFWLYVRDAIAHAQNDEHHAIIINTHVHIIYKYIYIFLTSINIRGAYENIYIYIFDNMSIDHGQ